TFADLAKVCREVPAAGEPFRELRARLRAIRFWDRDNPLVPLRFLGVGGATITPSPFMTALGATKTDEEQQAAILDRLWQLNPILFKAVFELAAQRPYGKDEIYKYLGSFAFRGTVPSRPGLESWLQLGIATGLLKPLGIAVAPGPSAERFAR